MGLKISNKEKWWLKENYPDLNFYEGDPAKISGLFKFDAVYNDLRIKDAYKIEIILQNTPPSILPRVKEIDGRIKNAKEKYNKKSFADVHLYMDDTSCLCTYLEEEVRLPKGFNLENFFKLLLIPHFFAQSQFEKTGEWIWGDRSHGTLGHLESYFEFRDKNNHDFVIRSIKILSSINDSKPFLGLLSKKEQIKGHVKCYCGSGKEFRNCHKGAFRGLWNLREDIRNMNIKLKDVI